ncbi:hypothetical protein QYF61_020633 [Mycteria americana]|uniref:Integrase catalytic domain-containing protein n=1 Tax=Mycteria americana TaxID=33587 RepID=A0AAN7NUW4_MYCAM|nr:hypothetical protein QYF61_020633 [Mycteria americana]
MVEGTTGWLETYPVPHATTQNAILGLEKQVLWQHGTPERMESDNGTHFQNNLIDTWAKEHGIEWAHKKLGGGTAKMVDPNWPGGYSIPYGVMLSIETGGSWPGGSDHNSGTGWASVSGWTPGEDLEFSTPHMCPYARSQGYSQLSLGHCTQPALTMCQEALQTRISVISSTETSIRDFSQQLLQLPSQNKDLAKSLALRVSQSTNSSRHGAIGSASKQGGKQPSSSQLPCNVTEDLDPPHLNGTPMLDIPSSWASSTEGGREELPGIIPEPGKLFLPIMKALRQQQFVPAALAVQGTRIPWAQPSCNAYPDGTRFGHPLPHS